LNNRLKWLNNWLGNRVKTLEEELNNSKIEFENLKMIYQKSSCKCVESRFCENFESLQKKIHYLLKMWTSFPKVNQILKLFFPCKIVILERLDWDLTQTARTDQFENPFLVSLKNN